MQNKAWCALALAGARATERPPAPQTPAISWHLRRALYTHLRCGPTSRHKSCLRWSWLSICDLYAKAVGAISISYALRRNYPAARRRAWQWRCRPEAGVVACSLNGSLEQDWPGSTSNARSRVAGAWFRVLCALHCLRLRLRPTVGDTHMSLELILGGAVTVALLVYLTWALLRPEKF